MRPLLTTLAFTTALAACSGLDLGLLAPPPDDGSVAVTDAGPSDDTSTATDGGADLDAPSTDVVTVADLPAIDTGTDTGVRDTGTDAAPRCGDGVCSAPRETCTNCPRDCGACPTDSCTSAGTSTCATCTPQNNCGWCTSTNQCLTGTSTGPDNHACTTAQWAWQTNQCPGTMTGPDPCLSHTSCTDCANQATCGWCANTRQCLTGTETGPNNGACSGTNWKPMATNCSG